MPKEEAKPIGELLKELGALKRDMSRVAEALYATGRINEHTRIRAGFVELTRCALAKAEEHGWTVTTPHFVAMTVIGVLDING